MKRILLSLTFLLLTSVGFSQVVFDLGLKAGVNFSKLNTSPLTIDEDLEITVNNDVITKSHWGAFGRIGLNKVYLQPEMYFTKKGGEISNDYTEMTSGFNYSAFDMPLLIGYEIFDLKAVDLKIFGGPVFSFVTDSDFDGDTTLFDEEYLNDKLFGFQAGVGVDVLFLTIDMRYEHCSDVYEQPGTISGNTNTFMLCVGFKIL